MNIGYIIVWAVLLVCPIVSLYRRYWTASIIFLAGLIIYLSQIFRVRDGWSDLANIATLIAVVLPIYIIGLLVAAWSVYRRKGANKPN